jgi:hypothetical protein
LESQAQRLCLSLDVRLRLIMRQFIAILIFAVLLIPSLASAKRGPQPRVDPVDYQGVRYTAHVEGRRHCVQASDIKTGKMLWDVTVYRTFIVPFMEEDVQWVFIKQMFIADGKLIVVAEDERGYSVDLQSHAVKKLKHVPKKPQPNTALEPTPTAPSAFAALRRDK